MTTETITNPTLDDVRKGDLVRRWIMSNHTMVFEFDRGSVQTEMRCTAPEGADCRLVGDCDCERGMIEQAEDGTPCHVVENFDGEQQVHWMRDGGECNFCLWVNECPEELGQGHFTIAEVPVAIEWDEMGPEWRRVVGDE